MDFSNCRILIHFIKNSSNEANFVYLRVDYGHSALKSNPEYQQLPHNDGRKNILRLNTNEPGKFLRQDHWANSSISDFYIQHCLFNSIAKFKRKGRKFKQ